MFQLSLINVVVRYTYVVKKLIHMLTGIHNRYSRLDGQILQRKDPHAHNDQHNLREVHVDNSVEVF